MVGRALDAGVNLFDTADVYGNGTSEEILGAALRAHRDEVLIATKTGFGSRAPGALSYTNVVASCEASLRRLGTDHIDLYQLHRPDRTTPIEETLAALDDLVTRGLVREVGASNFRAWEVAGAVARQRALGRRPFTAVQVYYSLVGRDVEHEILPACRELGVGFVGYAPLGRGLLTGRIKSVEDLPPTDRRRRHPRFQGENLARNVELVRELESIAARYKASPAQIALAWLLAQGDDIVPIPGTSHVRNVEQNAAAADLELDGADLKRLTTIFAHGAGAGDRYMANVMKTVGI
jgi:aryl-alcohol dehydrogenase-like predicted oxidoreductase